MTEEIENQDPKKLWETEFVTMCNKTNTMIRIISSSYMEGVNYQEACESLEISGLTYLRLTGKNYEDIKDIIKAVTFYESISKPSELVKGMTYDDFHDWLDLGTEEDIRDALKVFKEDGTVSDHVAQIEGYLKHKYGDKEI